MADENHVRKHVADSEWLYAQGRVPGFDWRRLARYWVESKLLLNIYSMPTIAMNRTSLM